MLCDVISAKGIGDYEWRRPGHGIAGPLPLLSLNDARACGTHTRSPRAHTHSLTHTHTLFGSPLALARLGNHSLHSLLALPWARAGHALDTIIGHLSEARSGPRTVTHAKWVNLFQRACCLNSQPIACFPLRASDHQARRESRSPADGAQPYELSTPSP